MKKHWKLVLAFSVVLVLTIILLFIFIFAQSSTTTNSQSTNIANPFADVSSTSENLSTFTENCYKSYLQAYISNIQSNNPGQFNTDATSCFTKEFIDQWPSISADSESDPVLLSQDYRSSWQDNISGFISNQTASNATVVISLGTGLELLQLFVELQLTSSGWRISGVTNSS